MLANRRDGAQSIVEVVFGIVFLFIGVLMLVDLAMVIYGVELNDIACQNAARAAAAGAPSEARTRAHAVVDGMSQPRLISTLCIVPPVETKISSQPPAHTDDDTGEPFAGAGQVCGDVTVQTEVAVRPLCLHMVLGGRSPLKFRSRHTFPISYVAPGE
jgi:hypothetical protein